MSPKYIGKKHTYRINDLKYSAFKLWCYKNGFDVSSAIRGAIGLLRKQGNISLLLDNENLRNMAVQLLNKN